MLFVICLFTWFFFSFPFRLSSQIDLDLAVSLSVEAGDKIKAAFHLPKNISSKSTDVDVVTETDKECEKLIISAISSKYPDHKFIAEESHTTDGVYDMTDAPTWIIDPVDGTTNFVHAFPFTCVSIGLMIEQKVVLGVVHNPIIGETFTAIRGHGAFLNGNPIQTSKVTDMTSAMISSEFGYERTPVGSDAMLKKIKNLLVNHMQGFRSLGSCAMNMCYVAAGRIDLYYEGKDEHFGPKPWDMAASLVILEEAGGIGLDHETGKPLDICSGRVLAGNTKVLSEKVIKILNSE